MAEKINTQELTKSLQRKSVVHGSTRKANYRHWGPKPKLQQEQILSHYLYSFLVWQLQATLHSMQWSLTTDWTPLVRKMFTHPTNHLLN